MRQQLDNAALEECRRNPALAARDGLVVCLECGLLVARLTRSPNCHARRVHNLDAKAYLAKWPGAPLASIEADQTERKARKAYLSAPANRELIKKQRRARYKEICEIAESDPASPEAAWLKKQHHRSAASWEKSYWGKNGSPGKPDPKDKAAALFRKNESSRHQDRHEANKEQDNKQGRDWYAANLQTEREKRRKRAAEMRQFARRARAKGISLEPKKRGRRAEDQTGARVDELYNSIPRLDWEAIKEQMDREGGVFRTVGAYQEARRRYLLKKPTK
jgi:hypothetical protein